MEQLIFDQKIMIKALDFHPELDLLLVILNTGAVLRQRISSFPRLKGAGKEELKNYEIIGQGAGIHWPALDEDLSLKGFITATLKELLAPNPGPLAA